MAPAGSTVASTVRPGWTQAAGTAAFQEAAASGSLITVGTEAALAGMSKVWTVVPDWKVTRTPGWAVFVWLAFTKTRTQALRSATRETVAG